MKRKKDEPLFDDLGFDDDHINQKDEDDYEAANSMDMSDEDDPEELERRKVKYAELRKSDKIFNNSYNMGSSSSDEGEEMRLNSDIKLDIGSAYHSLYDREQFSDHIDDTITQYDINQYISGSDEISTILGDNPEKKKFNKQEINTLFQLIVAGVTQGEHSSVFVSPIHVLDSISSMTNMEYKKLFDMLTYDNKETLLLELNKKYGFLDKPSKNLKMF